MRAGLRRRLGYTDFVLTRGLELYFGIDCPAYMTFMLPESRVLLGRCAPFVVVERSLDPPMRRALEGAGNEPS